MEGHRCPMCNGRIANEGKWERHVVECKRKRRQKKIECECANCDYATNKKSDWGDIAALDIIKLSQLRLTVTLMFVGN